MKSYLWTLLLPLLISTVGNAQSGTGLGIATVGITGADQTGSSQIPFDLAIMNLVSTGGGTIYVFAGTYTFSSKVAISKSIRILCQPGVVIQRASTLNDYLFDFQTGSQGSSIAGMGILVPPQDTSTRPLVNVDSAEFSMERCSLIDLDLTPGMSMLRVTENGDTLTVQNSTFDFRTSSDSLTGDYYGLNIGTSAGERVGTVIQNNTFLFSKNDGGNIVTGIRLVGGRGLRMLGNYFRPSSETETDVARMKYAVDMEDEVFGVVSHNVFRRLGFPGEAPETAAVLAEAVIRVQREEHPEGHHFAVTGNQFDTCSSLHNIYLLEPRFYAVTGNVMSTGIGGIEIDTTAEESGAESIDIAGNQFHDMGNVQDKSESTPVYIPTIRAARVTSLNITGNQFTDCPQLQVDLKSTVNNAHVASNQFVRSATTGGATVAAPIEYAGGIGHLVHCNSAIRSGGNVWSTWATIAASILAADISNLDNYIL